MNQKVLEWLAGRDTGLSSRAIVAWLERDKTLAARDGNTFEYPRDPADLGRCIRLLDIEPSYRERIAEMAPISPSWARLVTRWADLETAYRKAEQTGNGRECYDLIQEINPWERRKAEALRARETSEDGAK